MQHFDSQPGSTYFEGGEAYEHYLNEQEKRMTTPDDLKGDDYWELRCYELQDALRPFAALTTSEESINDKSVPDNCVLAAMSYTAGDYRRARALLKGK